MDRREEEFERYLRQFQPKAPNRLLGRSRTVQLRLRASIALAAAVVVIGSLAGWFALGTHHHLRTNPPTKTVSPPGQVTAPVGPPEVSLARLNAMMRRSPSQFDAALMDISQRLLPNVQNSHGSLYALASE